jgi:hypothetical protein
MVPKGNPSSTSSYLWEYGKRHGLSRYSVCSTYVAIIIIVLV